MNIKLEDVIEIINKVRQQSVKALPILKNVLSSLNTALFLYLAYRFYKSEQAIRNNIEELKTDQAIKIKEATTTLINGLNEHKEKLLEIEQKTISNALELKEDIKNNVDTLKLGIKQTVEDNHVGMAKKIVDFNSQSTNANAAKLSKEDVTYWLGVCLKTGLVILSIGAIWYTVSQLKNTASSSTEAIVNATNKLTDNVKIFAGASPTEGTCKDIKTGIEVAAAIKRGVITKIEVLDTEKSNNFMPFAVYIGVLKGLVTGDIDVEASQDVVDSIERYKSENIQIGKPAPSLAELRANLIKRN